MTDVISFELRALKQLRLVLLLLVGLLVIHLVGCAGEDGSNGTSCTVTQDDETGTATIDCEDGTSAVVQGGIWVETAAGELLGPAWPSTDGTHHSNIITSVYIQDLRVFMDFDVFTGRVVPRVTPYYVSDDCTGQAFADHKPDLSELVTSDYSDSDVFWVYPKYELENLLTLTVGSRLVSGCVQFTIPNTLTDGVRLGQVEDPRYPYAAPLRFVTVP